MASEISGLVPQHLMADEKDQARQAKNVLGKDDFMKLLMTQLRHQDPMKPMDHTEMGQQLAQFSQLEQLTNIGAGIQGLRTDKDDSTKLQLLGLIGKRVQAAGSEVDLTQGEAVTLRPNLKGDATPVKATIYDGGGKLVREIELVGQKPGEGIQWDGKDNEGSAVPSGKYTFRVHGVGKNGQAEDIGTELSGRVVGMEMNGKAPILVVQTPSGTSKLEIGKVTQVSLDETEAKATKPAVSLPGVVPAVTPVAVERPGVEVADAFPAPGHGWQDYLGGLEKGQAR